MALYGLSPLFLSLLTSKYFTDPSMGLNITRFLLFMALATGIIHLIGAFTLRIPQTECDAASIPDSASVSSRDDESSIDEHQPLLPNKAPLSESCVRAGPVDQGSSALRLFKDPHFWLLAFILLIILGSVSSVTGWLRNTCSFDQSFAVRDDHLEYRNYHPLSVSRARVWHHVPPVLHRNRDRNPSPPYIYFQHTFTPSFWPTCGLDSSSHRPHT